MSRFLLKDSSVREWIDPRRSDRDFWSDPSLLLAASRYCTEVHDATHSGRVVSSFSLTYEGPEFKF